MRDFYISRIDLSILLQEICGPILGTYISLTEIGTDPRNIYISLTEIGTEAAQFPEADYIKGIFVTVQHMKTILVYRWRGRQLYETTKMRLFLADVKFAQNLISKEEFPVTVAPLLQGIK